MTLTLTLALAPPLPRPANAKPAVTKQAVITLMVVTGTTMEEDRQEVDLPILEQVARLKTPAATPTPARPRHRRGVDERQASTKINGSS